MSISRFNDTESNRVHLYCRMICPTSRRAMLHIFLLKRGAYPVTMSVESNKIRGEDYSVASNPMNPSEQSYFQLNNIASSKMRFPTKPLCLKHASMTHVPWPGYIHRKRPVAGNVHFCPLNTVMRLSSPATGDGDKTKLTSESRALLIVVDQTRAL